MANRKTPRPDAAERREQILGELTQEPGLTYSQLARSVGLKSNVLHNTLMAIENRGTLLYEDQNGGLFIYQRIEL